LGGEAGISYSAVFTIGIAAEVVCDLHAGALNAWARFGLNELHWMSEEYELAPL